MPTVDELLNVELFAETGDAHEQEIYCIIHPDSRTIEVPEEYQLLGVENDKKVERLWFQCPKVVGDNKDISDGYVLFINYRNANGDSDAYRIKDMEIEGENITFSWELEEKVTAYQGTVDFSFRAIKPEKDSENKWNTTINSDCNVLLGLQANEQITKSEPDALAQIWAAIDELKAGGGGSGTPGKDGVGIDRIEKTSTQGLVDIYTIYLTDDRTYTFTVTNGKDGNPGEKGDPGDTGKPGKAATIKIGSVTTGDTASVANSGTDIDAVFDFVFPSSGSTSGMQNGIPSGGTIGQTLIKGSDEDYDVKWADAEYVTPEMYGAEGDGIQDDVDAFTQAIATGKPILLTQKYYVSASITFTQSVYSYTNAEIVHDAIVMFHGDNTLVSGVTFNGNESSPYVHCAADNVHFFKCQFKNFSGNDNYKQTFTLRLGEYNTVVHTGIVVDSCVFDGATSEYENGVEGDSQGVIRQIYVQNCSAKIVNCEFKNCIGKEDADIIHVQSVSELNSNYPYEKMSGICFTAVPCIIEGNTFHLSKCKSAIKIQCSDVIVQNNIILIEDEEMIDGSRYAFRASVCNNVTISSNIVDIKDASSLKLSSVFMIEAMENIIIQGNLVYDNATGLGGIYDSNASTTVLISRFTQTSIFSNNSILLRAIHNLLDVEYSTIVISGNKIECVGNYPDSILYIGKYYNHAVDGSDISEDVVLRFNGNEIIVTGIRSKIRVETSYAGSVDFSNNIIRGGIESFEFQFNANAPTTFCRVCDIDIPLTFTTKSGSYLTTLESISIERCTIVYADLQKAVSCLIKDCDISSTYQAIYLTDVGKIEADGNYIHDITNRLFRIMTGNPVIEMKNNRFDDMNYKILIESHYNNDSFQRNNITWHKDNKGAITGINTGTEPDSTMSYDLGFSFYKESENKFVFSNGKGEWV